MLHILTALVLFSACRKDKTEFVLSDNLLFQVTPCDSMGMKQTYFANGSNIQFKTSMTNLTDKNIFYFEGLKCASLKLELYRDDAFFGVPYPNNSVCSEMLELEEIVGNESKQSSISWLDNPENEVLPSGNYKIIFKSKIAINESNKIEVGKALNWIPINAESTFTIQ